MTKDEILEYIQKTLNSCNSKEMLVDTEQIKDKLILTVQTWDSREKFAITVKRME